jgi:hypothetical protein
MAAAHLLIRKEEEEEERTASKVVEFKVPGSTRTSWHHRAQQRREKIIKRASLSWASVYKKTRKRF